MTVITVGKKFGIVILELLRDSYKYREAVCDSYNGREEVCVSYTCQEAVTDS